MHPLFLHQFETNLLSVMSTAGLLFLCSTGSLGLQYSPKLQLSVTDISSSSRQDYLQVAELYPSIHKPERGSRNPQHL